MGLSKAPAIAVNPQPAKQKVCTGPNARELYSYFTQAAKKTGATPGRLDPALQHAAHLTKPQLKFKRRVNNKDLAPWRPTLKHKYNAQVPLGYEYHDENVDMNQDSLYVGRTLIILELSITLVYIGRIHTAMKSGTYPIRPASFRTLSRYLPRHSKILLSDTWKPRRTFPPC